MRKVLTVFCFSMAASLHGMQYDAFTGASDLRSITFEVNNATCVSQTKMQPSRLFQLKKSVTEKQRLFESMHQLWLVTHCKFMYAMLIAHGQGLAVQGDLSGAAALLLEAADEEHTDAQEIVLTSTGKTSMLEVSCLRREEVLSCIKKRLQVPMLVKEDFLRRGMIEEIVSKLAILATGDDSSDITAVIPSADRDILDDSQLTKNRNRFRSLLGCALPLLSEKSRLDISTYIDHLEKQFQESQIENFGVSAYEDIEPRSFSKEIIPVEVLCTTGGFPELLATTPDVVFSGFKEVRLQDFRSVVSFISIARLIATSENSDLSDKIRGLFVFSEKWGDSSVASYLSYEDTASIEEAQNYMRSVRQLIEELK